MPRNKDWYIEQYNRNREYSDWIFDYEQIKENGRQKQNEVQLGPT